MAFPCLRRAGICNPAIVLCTSGIELSVMTVSSSTSLPERNDDISPFIALPPPWEFIPPMTEIVLSPGPISSTHLAERNDPT